MKLAFIVVKFLAGGLGVVLFFYRNSLFTEFARAGTSKIDSTHIVLLNNHGSISFITAEQDARLQTLLILSIVLLALMFGIHFLQRRFAK